MSQHSETPESQGWFDHPRNVDRLFWGLVAASAVSVVMSVFLHPHGHLEYENLFGFHAIFGFVACLIIVGGAVLMRRFLKREEDYYDE